MTRTYSEFANESIKVLLNTLADESSAPELYRTTMVKLGMALGDVILAQISHEQCNVYLACTVEDADFLAKGMLLRLEKQLPNVAFACFWNQRFSPFEVEDITVAPILRKYQEPSSAVNYLIIVKSIISGACVVKTNLINLIQNIKPENIFIVAPVIYHKAEEKLRNAFEQSTYDKFRFFYFAKDNQRTSKGEVIPGIGGSVYERLGFQGQDDKNRHTPEIVKSRRKLISV
ncbi:hypothetical protein IQ230_03175 [Gloeocapsopsis crepidinum LEGE 06123]|uniref:Uncharacterized protein n=1 Tax=Gloeocapsopsis crepidinum LEGE 06123 TaxID=588587 RepID=A0ABR9UM67_9CHRO|nr:MULTISPECIES: hypothetical protein [Gloeocapsopsis]MBE9189381.1 hypothetical protein [Gloeocapsopsis crepidinum LEGE 06123]PIG94420.1 hypothetical protein CSQ79_03770 [Gloeocapsopsis sp. IPPAS B-1203]